ncbi:MAG: VOC family protein [Candidatus Eremiobacteraeota bacterium]|nr:VOC family protein [Candidatus Eremiobacteraeota bacterium]
MIRIDRLDHLVLTVKDAASSCDFYERVLGFRTLCAEGRWSLAFGRQKINLHQGGSDFDPKAERPTVGSGDLCFISTETVPDILRHLDALHVEIVDGPVGRHGAIGPMTSVYCRDPDGNLIEIAVYAAS